MYAIGRTQHQTDNSWPNVVAFAFKKDNVAKLDGVKPGMRVKVEFAVDGRCFERCASCNTLSDFAVGGE